MGHPDGGDWKIDQVRQYLEGHFPGKMVEHFPRGRIAELFRVLDQGRVIHQLYIAKKFLDRVHDREMLTDALAVASAAGRMRSAGSVTVELY